MKKLTKIFISVNKEIKTIEISFKKFEIGIIEEEFKDKCAIFFVISNKSLTLSKNDFEIFNVKKLVMVFLKKFAMYVIDHYLLINLAEIKMGKGDSRIIRRPSCNYCRVIIDGVNASQSEKRKWEETKPEYEPFQCPICKKITIPSLTSKIILDHDHSNGKIRGWICDSCNTGIGRFKDGITLLKKAINYLQSKKTNWVGNYIFPICFLQYLHIQQKDHIQYIACC